MKRILCISLLIFFILSIFIGCSSNNNESNEQQEQSETGNQTYKTLEIEAENFGKMTFRLDEQAAPLTVQHIIELAENNSMVETYFNRMDKGFVLQGGAGCSDTTTVKGEFTSNGVNNTLKHTTGVISMARSSDPDSASSQFFIVLSDSKSVSKSLDGNYAAFGVMTSGLDVLNNICSSFTSEDFLQDYYGTNMGFLNPSSYIKIIGFKVY